MFHHDMKIAVKISRPLFSEIVIEHLSLVQETVSLIVTDFLPFTFLLNMASCMSLQHNYWVKGMPFLFKNE